MSTRRM
ncbi:hypothetical protein CcCBS67573_g03930 [Chytriomyces confervae]|nr:hypothetical protein CcCBS67573_g03930 [Chytriomyces confervae]